MTGSCSELENLHFKITFKFDMLNSYYVPKIIKVYWNSFSSECDNPVFASSNARQRVLLKVDSTEILL